MPTSVVVFYKCHPDFSPTEFRNYMEQIHVPIVKEVMGDLYPTIYTRRYPERVESGAGERLGAPAASRKSAHPTAPVVIVGSPDDLGWDMMGELVFRDELHLQQGFAMMNAAGGQRIRDDEENFTIPSQLKVVLMGQSIAT